MSLYVSGLSSLCMCLRFASRGLPGDRRECVADTTGDFVAGMKMKAREQGRRGSFLCCRRKNVFRGL